MNADDVKTFAREAGFDLCGIAPAKAFPELRFLDDWLERGYAGEMRYLARNARRRSDVREVVPSALSVISLGTLYNTDRPYSTEVNDPDAALISRYAWGEDYHDVVGRRTEALLERMRAATGEPFSARCYVDTGPVQERVYAQHAGLGWIGKNTCLINPEQGSWFFLAEIITSLPLEPDAPQLDQCGTCTLCLEACPTGAFPEPRVLDATRCLSYLRSAGRFRKIGGPTSVRASTVAISARKSVPTTRRRCDRTTRRGNRRRSWTSPGCRRSGGSPTRAWSRCSGAAPCRGPG